MEELSGMMNGIFLGGSLPIWGMWGSGSDPYGVFLNKMTGIDEV